MKKMRLLMAIIAITLAVGSAFATKSKFFTASTWYFKGTVGQENDRTKYQLSAVQGVTCGGNGILCSIVDQPAAGGTTPLLSHGTVSTSNSAYFPTQRQ